MCNTRISVLKVWHIDRYRHIYMQNTQIRLLMMIIIQEVYKVSQSDNNGNTYWTWVSWMDL